MGKICKHCKKFSKYSKKIDGAIVLAWTHGQWDEDENITFIYCPYCGNKLEESK